MNPRSKRWADLYEALRPKDEVDILLLAIIGILLGTAGAFIGSMAILGNDAEDRRKECIAMCAPYYGEVKREDCFCDVKWRTPE